MKLLLAVWIRFLFTSTGGDFHRFEAIDDLGYWYHPPAYHDSLYGLALPKPSGGRDTLWTPISRDGRWRLFHVRVGKFGHGLSEPSNECWIVAGARDSAYYLIGDKWKFPVNGVVSWSLRPSWHGDYVQSQEQVQMQAKAELCRIYGYWMLRGVRQACR